MTTIVTRAGKGSTLSWAEADANFTNLNTDKAEVSDVALKAPIASPTFTGTVSGITSSMVGLGNVDNTSDATKNAATATLTNKTITAAKLKAAQLGDSGTATNNFTLTAEAADGTMKLARGNIGATTQDLITVSSSNIITGASGATLVGNGPAFNVTASATQSLTVNVSTKVAFNTKTFDLTNNFDTTTNTFTAPIAGYYQINASAGHRIALNTFGIYVVIMKNGVVTSSIGMSGGTANSYAASGVSELLYLAANDTVAINMTLAGPSGTGTCVGGTFSGYLARSA